MAIYMIRSEGGARRRVARRCSPRRSWPRCWTPDVRECSHIIAYYVIVSYLSLYKQIYIYIYRERDIHDNNDNNNDNTSKQ